MPRFTHDGRPVQLSYSTNVHPAKDLAAVRTFLADETTQIRKDVAPDRPFGVCLHLSQASIQALQAPGELDAFAEHLARNELEVVAINGFPLGDFHAPVVKERAYDPDWTTALRLRLTKQIADLFQLLLPTGTSGTISTLAGSFKPWGDDFTVHERVAEQLANAARHLLDLRERTGTSILLGLEPEPFTTLETLEEVLAFFERHVEPAAKQAGLGEAWRDVLGLNVDLCHQAVQFESLESTLDALIDAGIRIGSVHAAAALRIPLGEEREENLARLAAFDEARYLHQVVGADESGAVQLRVADLPALLERGDEELRELAELRCHFHVPLQSGTIGGLPTTAEATAAAVRHLLSRGACDAIVAETYTWGVGPLTPGTLADRLAEELNWLIERVGLQRAP